jgi:hypothetical protein
MEKMHMAFLMLAVLALSMGCAGLANDSVSYLDSGSSAGRATSEKAVPSYSAAPSSSSPGAAGITTQQDQMVIKTGTAEIDVPAGKIAERYAALQTLAKAYGGEVYSSSYYESDAGKTQYVTVRIKSADFDAFTNRLSEIGTVKSMSSGSEDVTQEYIDVSAKLTNLEASRDRLLALYNKTGNLSDIILLEQEISRVQYQIDSATQTKQYYERQSSKATVSITLSEPLPVVNTSLFDPFSQLANFFVGSLAVGVTLVVVAIGFLLPLALLVFVIWKIAARLLRKK